MWKTGPLDDFTRTLHVWPLAEEEFHDTRPRFRPECFCQPQLEIQRNGTLLVIHREGTRCPQASPNAVLPLAN